MQFHGCPAVVPFSFGIECCSLKLSFYVIDRSTLLCKDFIRFIDFCNTPVHVFVKIHNEPRKKSAVLFDFNYCVLLIIVQGYSSLDLA